MEKEDPWPAVELTFNLCMIYIYMTIIGANDILQTHIQLYLDNDDILIFLQMCSINQRVL